MGAQTPDRLQQFKKRYNDWDDPQGETQTQYTMEKFMYPWAQGGKVQSFYITSGLK